MSDWQKIKGGAEMPDGTWSRLTPLLSVQGVAYRKDNAQRFADVAIAAHAKTQPFGLLIEPEPSNPHDANALKAIGWCRGKTFHTGYVEADEAARTAERYPGAPVAAEFYSLYQGTTGFIDIQYFLAVAAGAKPTASSNVRRLLEITRDELSVLAYAARADDKLGRLEHDILNRYAQERANDLRVSLRDEDIKDMKRWCKEQAPTPDEIEAAIDRLSDRPDISVASLWELIEIVLTIDGKISKSEKAVAWELANHIERSFGTNPLQPT